MRAIFVDGDVEMRRSGAIASRCRRDECDMLAHDLALTLVLLLAGSHCDAVMACDCDWVNELYG